MTAISEREFEREVRRVFRRFAEPESYAMQAGETEFGVFVARNGHRRPVLLVGEIHWAAFERRDLIRIVETSRSNKTWRASEVGLAYWRRLDAAVDPFRAQHQLRVRKSISVDGAPVTVEMNEAETSLGWLRRRKGTDGKPLISEAQAEAGERLRRDFTLAQMAARVTADWSMALGPDGSGRRPRDPAEVTDRALAARQRFAKALDVAGADLAGVLVEACCNQRGLAEIERNFGWPQRAGKVVLQIALDRLVAHYRLGAMAQ